MKTIIKIITLILFVKTVLYCQPFYIDDDNRMGGPYIVDPYAYIVCHRPDVAISRLTFNMV